MIESDEQLQQSRRVLKATEEALAALYARVSGLNQNLFSVMAESYIADIRRIRVEIDDYIGLSSASVDSIPLWFSLEGPTLNKFDISSRLLTEWLSRFRKAILNVTEYLHTGIVRTSGRPSIELTNSTDPRLVTVSPGSIRIGLRFLPPVSVQADLFESEENMRPSSPRYAVERLLTMAVWAQSSESVPPTDEFPDTDEAIVVASQLSDMVPSRKGEVGNLKFEGAMLPSEKPIFIYPDQKPKLRKLVQDLSSLSEERVIGVIREIDLDAQRIIIRERGEGISDLRCHLDENLIEVAELLLDKTVIVSGLISSVTPNVMDVKNIEEKKTS